jgi:dipeptidyl aminopeptidase/acylaminoacyl peptidase
MRSGGLLLLLARLAICFSLLSAAVCSAATLANNARHPATVDDLLRMEDIGKALLLKDGRLLVYERMPPYETAPNIDMLGSVRDTRILAKLYVRDMRDPTVERELFPQEPARGYSLGKVSPDRSRIAFYMHFSGQVAAGVFDQEQNAVVTFDFTPNYRSGEATMAWISNEEAVYATVPADQLLYFSRRQVARRITDLWERSFRGLEPSVSVLRSTRDGVRAIGLEAGSLVRVNTRTSRVVAIAGGRFVELYLSPDRRYLAALRQTHTIQPQVDHLPNAHTRLRSELVLINLDTNIGMPVACAGCNVLSRTVAWAADGRTLTFLANEANAKLSQVVLHSYDVASHSLSTIEGGRFRFACGTHFQGASVPIAVTRDRAFAFGRVLSTPHEATLPPPHRCASAERFDWFAIGGKRAARNLTSGFRHVSGRAIAVSDDGVFVLADGDLWELREDGRPRNLTASLDEAIISSTEEDVRTIGDDDPHVVLETRNKIITFNIRTGLFKEIRRKPDRKLLAVSSRGRTAIFRRDSVDGTSVTFVRGTDPERPVFTINQHLANVAPPKEVRITYSTPPGLTLSSCMLLPPNWNSKRRYPLIVYVYPGVSGKFCYDSGPLRFQPLNMQLLAAQNYIVLFAATPRRATLTESGFGGEITSAVLAAVDKAIELGFADPERVGLFGFSQGFREVLQIISETGRFGAAIAGNGLSNLASHYGQMALARHLEWRSGRPPGNFARYEDPVSATWLDATPWEHPERYVRNSPVFQADKVQTPVLLMYSDLDDFPLAQADEFFSALYRLRKEATYVIYWGEAHGNLSPANIRDSWRRITGWFDKHLTTKSSVTFKQHD